MLGVTYIKVDIICIDFGQGVRHASHVDDHSLRGQDLPDDQVCEKEMAEIIGSKVTFNPVAGLLIFALSGNSCVVDKNIDLVGVCVQPVCCLPDRGVVQKVNWEESEFDAVVDRSDLLDHRGDFGLVTAR